MNNQFTDAKAATGRARSSMVFVLPLSALAASSFLSGCGEMEYLRACKDHTNSCDSKDPSQTEPVILSARAPGVLGRQLTVYLPTGAVITGDTPGGAVAEIGGTIAQFGGDIVAPLSASILAKASGGGSTITNQLTGGSVTTSVATNAAGGSAAATGGQSIAKTKGGNNISESNAQGGAGGAGGAGGLGGTGGQVVGSGNSSSNSAASARQSQTGGYTAITNNNNNTNTNTNTGGPMPPQGGGWGSGWSGGMPGCGC